MSSPETIVPEVGMGATMGVGSDRYAMTITEVKHFNSGARKGQPRSVTVQSDNATIVGGNSGDGSAQYEYTPDPNGMTREFTIRPNGKWVQRGQGVRFGSRLGIGHRDQHYDPHR